MSEWYDSQKKPSSNFRKFLQERINKENPPRTLTADEKRRLTKLEAVAEKLRRGENVQNRQLQTWLNTDEYEQIAAEWAKTSRTLADASCIMRGDSCLVLNTIIPPTTFLESKHLISL